MNDSSNFMMIGLHKLAAERGDGLIPELLTRYRQRDVAADRAMPPVSASHIVERETSMACAGNDNVIPFLPYLLARKER